MRAPIGADLAGIVAGHGRNDEARAARQCQQQQPDTGLRQHRPALQWTLRRVRLTRRRTTGPYTVAAARCSCNRASYPGDGVTVGGAARAGNIEAQPARATTATIPTLT